MSMELITYPFLFLGIFFDCFLLITLLSKPAREARTRVPGLTTPPIAIIVPCYNEATTIVGTCESLLALDYPQDKLEIVLVNDGSTDGTREIMDTLIQYPQVRIIHKENGGKHTALNAGMALTSAEFIGCLDADSFVDPQALRELIPSFTSERVAAVTAAMSIYQPKNIIEHMQNAEYTFGITMRHAIAVVNGLYVTPGPFSFYRRSVVETLGGFRFGHQTEDMEMALRIQKAGYEIENAPRARVYTKAPNTIPKLIKQRTRWTSGFLRNVLGEYRGLILNRRYGTLGMLMLPLALIALGSGILLFFVGIFQIVHGLTTSIGIHADIPLTYVFAPHTLDWFYVPVSTYALLAVISIGSAFALTIFGKSLSKTPMSLAIGLISYTFLGTFLAPLWLLRATSDVALQKHRHWR